MKSEFCKVDILSPVHIGTGDTVDPFHYLIDDSTGEPVCYFIDPGAWATDHPDPEELLKIFSGSNIAQMRAELAEQVDTLAYAERRCRVVSSKVVSDYKKHLDKPESRNQLLLAPNLTGGGGGPLLPGSSLKGAIRTAVIDWLDREKNLGLKQCRTLREQEQKLEPYFGKITENTFQGLKVADCEAARNTSLIVEAREVRRNPEKSVTPKASCEILASRLLGDSEANTLGTRIALGRANEKSAGITLKNGTKLDWSKLCELVNAYSAERYREEQRKFWNLSHFRRSKEALSAIEGLILAPPENSMVLKVGHYSQIEYVTVENNRPQTRKTKDGKTLPHGTTRTLADGIYPFGWVLLTPCSEEEYRDLMARRDAVNTKIRQRQAEMREKRQAEVKQRREEARQRRLEEEVRRREAEERAREEAEKPWLKWVRHLRTITDWGSLKQLLEREEVVAHNSQPELAEAVLEAARRVRQHRPDKWTDERQSQVNTWLQAGGLELVDDKTEVPATDSPEDVTKIEGLNEFDVYQRAGLDLAGLSQPALRALRQKLKSWNCHKKSAKKNKQQAYKAVEKLLRKNN